MNSGPLARDREGFTEPYFESIACGRRLRQRVFLFPAVSRSGSQILGCPSQANLLTKLRRSPARIRAYKDMSAPSTAPTGTTVRDLAELNWPDPTLYQSGKTRLQELAELFWPQPGGSKDRAQGAAIKRPVVRYNDLSKRVIAPQDNVAAHLSNEAESYPLEGPLTNSAGNDWQVAHTVTRRASKCSSGTGSRSASSAST